MSATFLPEELQRYARHFSLPEVGRNGQEKLKAARVLCIGAGGLGSPLLYYLVGAGIGTIGIIDGDTVDISNLQRQILFDSEQIGLNKAVAAKDKLSRYNPHVNIQAYPIDLKEENALNIISEYHFVADCTDNFSSRYLINDACFHLKKPNISASISQFEGYCSVFYALEGPCYRCLTPNPPPAGLIPNCAERGVLGILPGLLGVIQANEIIKLILGIGNSLIGNLLVVDALSLRFNKFKIHKNNDCPLCMHQKTFFNIPRAVENVENTPTDLLHLSASQLKELKDTNQVFLVDVRESHEYEAFNLGGMLIPLDELNHRMHEIKTNKPIVVYCQSGIRSQKAARILLESGFTNIQFLLGGIQGWMMENQ